MFNHSIASVLVLSSLIVLSTTSCGNSNGVGADADLGSSSGYVILAKTGVSNATGSSITGNIGLSPAAQTYITGFALVEHATNAFATSSSVTGLVFSATDADPTPANLTSAIGSMETAYTELAGRPAGTSNLGAGEIGSLVIT